ncbi:hypothetical protein Pelo_10333 [Pelomyxa schiedti]|nr:hypothetical protein Pelo_10333 [Pelomyxa schiedti]
MGCGAPAASGNRLSTVSQREGLVEQNRGIEAHTQILGKLEELVMRAKDGSLPPEWDDMRQKFGNHGACPMSRWIGKVKGRVPNWAEMETLHKQFHIGLVKVMDVGQTNPSRARELLQSGDLVDTSKQLLLLVQKS